VLDEFDAVCLLLPQFDVTINRGGDNKVGPGIGIKKVRSVQASIQVMPDLCSDLVIVTKLIWSRCINDL